MVLTGFVDKIIYINLKQRTDRKQKIENQLHNFGLYDYIRVDAIKTTNGAVGCALSHIEALEIAIKNKYKRVLIMEDDFVFEVSPCKLHKKFALLSSSNFDFHVLLLSHNIQKHFPTHIPGISRVLESQTASGYIVHFTCFHTLLAIFKESAQTITNQFIAIDQYWKVIQPVTKWYAFYPRLGYQGPSYSDIEKKYVNYGC